MTPYAGYECTEQNITLYVQTISLSVFSLLTDAAEDCADADVVTGVVMNHLLSIATVCLAGFSGLSNWHHDYDSCSSQVSNTTSADSLNRDTIQLSNNGWIRHSKCKG